jgi:L-rhamnose isomerase/sugar isomerase
MNPSLFLKNAIESENSIKLKALNEDYDFLGRVLSRRGINIEDITAKTMSFQVAVPSWGTSTGGTRFAVFSGKGEPRNIFDKLEDCATVNTLARCTKAVSLHIPWDKAPDTQSLIEKAKELSLTFDAMNSNTFQDQKDQKLSYKYGSLTHTDKAVRDQAIAHNIECIKFGNTIGSKALTVWLGDGSNFAGQSHFRRAYDRYLDSLKQIYAACPSDWTLFIEHKCYEPAFYSTVLHDWGASYAAAMQVGERCKCLVDLGHHLPNANIEQIVSKLIQLGRLGGFHFNDSKYGDDDLDAGSIKPFQLFLIFNELVDAAIEGVKGFNPSYMIDESHNVTDPLESLIQSATEIERAFVQATIVDRKALRGYQDANDPIMALETLKTAFRTDVSPVLAMARMRLGGAIDPVGTFRKSGYRELVAKERNH